MQEQHERIPLAALRRIRRVFGRGLAGPTEPSEAALSRPPPLSLMVQEKQESKRGEKGGIERKPLLFVAVYG